MSNAYQDHNQLFRVYDLEANEMVAFVVAPNWSAAARLYSERDGAAVRIVLQDSAVKITPGVFSLTRSTINA